jgi:pimeloyl-[acyl-carrier protein] synthase
LRDQPEMIRTAVEELLRYESPVQYTHRVVKEDIELCGEPLGRGQVVAFMLGSAKPGPATIQRPIAVDSVEAE